MDTPAHRFLNYIEATFRKKAEIYKGEETSDDYPTPSILVFNDIPKPGYMTCVTYGLSYAAHEKWLNDRRPELIMSVNSQDPQWALALVDLVSKIRGQHPFSYGNTIKLGHPIVDTSNKTGFLFFSPAILGREVYMDIDIGLDYKICLTGAYPISDKNMDVISKIGLEKFWKSDDFEFIDVT